ncbi:MAG: GWxTD domain-containing protein [Bacteroidales bacterium]
MLKSAFITTLITALATTCLLGQNSGIQAYLSQSQFYSPKDGNYVEASLAVKGSSLTYQKQSDGKFKSKLQVTMIFSQNDTVKAFEKYNLFSPAVEDTSSIAFNFLDLKRFQLDTGAYDFSVTLNDEFNNSEPLQYSTPVFIRFDKQQLELSSIQFIESYNKAEESSPFTKNGIYMIPYLSDYFPEEVNTLSFYTEIYHSDLKLETDALYLVSYYLESYESKEVMNQYSSYKRMNAKPVNVVLSKFDIGELPTGNYNLVLELKDRNNKQIALKKRFFQRYNPKVNYDISNLEAVDVEQSFTEKMSRDSLLKFLPTLTPIASNLEKLFIHSETADKDLSTLQKFFLNFWRGKNAMEPEKAWVNYHKNVRQVEKFYSTNIHHGYQTDRGRVYLQYGPPNTINERDHEPSSYPYEIWHYHKLTNNQWNKKFVFYNPDLVTNDYELIHSNAIGEIYNPTWKYQLNKRNSITNDPYNTENPDHWGSEAEDLYNNPY